MPSLITTLQAAAALGISRARVLALIRAGRLSATKHGSQYLIKQSDLYQVRTRKPGRPPSKTRQEWNARNKRIEARRPMNDFEVIDAVRHAMWAVWLKCPEEHRPLVPMKFRQFAEELARTGDLSW